MKDGLIKVKTALTGPKDSDNGLSCIENKHPQMRYDMRDEVKLGRVVVSSEWANCTPRPRLPDLMTAEIKFLELPG